MLNIIPHNHEEKINFKELEWQYKFDFCTAEYTILLKHKNSIYIKTFPQWETMDMPNIKKLNEYNPFTWYNMSETILG